MSKSTAKKASSSVNYQDDVNIALDRKHDIDATVDEEDEEDEEDDEENSTESTSQVKDTIQASKNHSLSTLNSSASWKLGSADPNHKCS